VSQLNYVWNGSNSQPQPPAWPAVGLDWLDSVFYISSKPTKTQPSTWIAVGGLGLTPIIAAALQEVNATTPLSLSATATASVLYTASISLESVGNASAGHLVDVELTWTSPLTTHTISLTLPLDSPQLVMETYPIFTLANTSINLATSYAGGAVNDPYTISVRLLEIN
jgi:hypothetical protein